LIARFVSHFLLEFTHMRLNSILAASIVAAGLVFSVATPVSIAQASDVTEAQIAAAKTPADHEAIAAKYDAEAKAADEMAANHESMATAYKASNAKGTQSMAGHCNRLVAQYRDAAKEYRALATEHRSMASAAVK
jgi:hypothetical protein